MAFERPLREYELGEIAGEYGLDVLQIETMKRGASNLSYLLRTRQGEYVLTVFSISLDRAMDIARLLRLLAGHGFATKRLLLLPQGGMVVQCRGRAVMVTEYIPGQVCADLSETMLRQAGRAMAQLHQVPAPAFLSKQHAYGLQAFSTVIGLDISPEYESWLARNRIRLEQRISPELPRGLIHGDLFWDNVLFEGQRLRAIIDLEEACHSYLAFDLGMAIAGLCRAGSGISLDKARALVSGYQQVRRLTEGERHSLQLMAEYGAVATSYWRFWRYHVHTPSPDKAERHLGMVRLAESVADIPAALFCRVCARRGSSRSQAACRSWSLLR